MDINKVCNLITIFGLSLAIFNFVMYARISKTPPNRYCGIDNAEIEMIKKSIEFSANHSSNIVLKSGD